MTGPAIRIGLSMTLERGRLGLVVLLVCGTRHLKALRRRWRWRISMKRSLPLRQATFRLLWDRTIFHPAEWWSLQTLTATGSHCISERAAWRDHRHNPAMPNHRLFDLRSFRKQ